MAAKNIAETTAGTEQFKRRSQIKAIWFRFRKNKVAMFGLILLFAMIFLAATADFYFDYELDAVEHNISDRLQPPSAEHPFGTNEYGQDMLARIVYGAKILKVFHFKDSLSLCQNYVYIVKVVLGLLEKDKWNIISVRTFIKTIKVILIIW